MKNFFMNNLKSVFEGVSADEQDRGDLVQTVIIIAGFAVVTIAVVSWISTAIFGLGADTAKCLTGVQSFTGTATTTQENCEAQTHSEQAEDQIDADGTYQGRFG